ncbi:putative glycolipid-binding domain-containing protein [Salinibacterium sp. ZJ454]|uniref:putative glycolipid-binding domain-containing protein n=1 Tax=Salinibacterium sp. ZJ454 TaxID=2708339 RepID=UPI00142383DF|nr:putative glycolipid-binding domain-containing protein [Salinibacterium sp. ZJ454]
MAALFVWEGTDGWRAEAASVQLGSSGLTASGTQMGVDPLPYRLDYTLRTRDDFVTELLDVTAAGTGWQRRLILGRDESGLWSCMVQQDGAGPDDVDLAPPGGDMSALHDVLDCDLGLSPLTNTMPVLRHRLHTEPGTAELRMAWIAVPSLAVVSDRQKYQTVRADVAGPSVVRYSSHRFSAELEFDSDGFVLTYPGLARRVG